MMKSKFFKLSILFLIFVSPVFAQQNLMYNHYFINPSLYNPSFVGSNGYTELYLNYRKQWAGFKGAPTTGTLNLHLPLNYKSGIGFTAYQDQAGLIKTTTGLVTFSYQVYLGQTVSEVHKIAFGLSAGLTNSRLDISESDDINDPAMANNTSSIDGQFGLHYQLKNFKLAFAIPRLFQTAVASEVEFNKPGLEQFNNTISSLSYKFEFGRTSFEPMVTYRTFENQDAQYEALGILKLEEAGWIGGSYRQDYGAAAFIGLNLRDKIKVGYAYEFATQQSDKLGNGSHEVQLILRVGKKHFTRPGKIVKKTAQPVVVAQPVEEEEQEENFSEQSETSEANAPLVNSTTPHSSDSTDGEGTIKKEVATKLNGESLPPGHYVVVGAFQSVMNAKAYAMTLKRAGYPASVAYQAEKLYYIVHMINAPTIEEARLLRNKYRQMSRYSFRDTWILSVE